MFNITPVRAEILFFQTIANQFSGSLRRNPLDIRKAIA
jgi:hypothetical protein